MPTAVSVKPHAARPMRLWNDPDSIIDLASSDETRAFINGLRRLQPRPSASSESTEPPEQHNLERRLYDARAKAKLYTAITLHTAKEWRDGLFRQLDSLLDVDEWAEGDSVLTEGSFATFIRIMFVLRPHERPGLGITSEGNLIASWSCGQDRLTVECWPDDKVRWVVSQNIAGEMERTAGSTTVQRLPDVLQPYPISVWIRHGAVQRS